MADAVAAVGRFSCSCSSSSSSFSSFSSSFSSFPSSSSSPLLVGWAALFPCTAYPPLIRVGAAAMAMAMAFAYLVGPAEVTPPMKGVHCFRQHGFGSRTPILPQHPQARGEWNPPSAARRRSAGVHAGEDGAQAENRVVWNANVAIEEGLNRVKSGKYEEALQTFEKGLGLPSGTYERKYPMPLPGGGGGAYSNAKISEKETRALLYNMACCHSKMGQMEKSLGAMKQCLDAGYQDIDTILEDPDLEFLRTSPNLKQMLDEVGPKNPFDWIVRGFNPE